MIYGAPLLPCRRAPRLFACQFSMQVSVPEEGLWVGGGVVLWEHGPSGFRISLTGVKTMGFVISMPYSPIPGDLFGANAMVH